MKRPFSRSYEAILPSSLAMIHSSALGFSPRPPVSVYGTGCIYLMLRKFSRKSAWGHYRPEPKSQAYYRVSTLMTDLPVMIIAYALQPPIPSGGKPYAPPSLLRSIHRYRNINLFSIDFTSRLRLRPRLTLF
jgi:hypothetical protein